jgi:hypothetical protein
MIATIMLLFLEQEQSREWEKKLSTDKRKNYLFAGNKFCNQPGKKSSNRLGGQIKPRIIPLTK